LRQCVTFAFLAQVEIAEVPTRCGVIWGEFDGPFELHLSPFDLIILLVSSAEFDACAKVIWGKPDRGFGGQAILAHDRTGGSPAAPRPATFSR